MKRVIINGVGGQMGRALVQSLSEQKDEWEIAAGIDPFCTEKLPFPLYADTDELNTDADVVISALRIGCRSSSVRQRYLMN